MVNSRYLSPTELEDFLRSLQTEYPDLDAILLWTVNTQRQIQLSCAAGKECFGDRNAFFIPQRLQALGQVFDTGHSRIFTQSASGSTFTCCQIFVRENSDTDCVLEWVWKSVSLESATVLQLCQGRTEWLWDHQRIESPAPPAVTKSQPVDHADIDEFLLRLYSSQNSKEVLALAANDGRILLGVDRLGIALRRGSNARVVALSGQVELQQRSPYIKALNLLATHVLGTGEELRYLGDSDKLSPLVSDLLTEYVRESRARMLWILPLRVPQNSSSERSTDNLVRTDPLVIGCTIIEQARESQLSTVLENNALRLSAHLGTALHNCQRIESIFLLPIWKRIGSFLRSLHGRKLYWSTFCTAVSATFVLLLIYVPWEYKVTCNGRLMPSERADLYAPWNADVVEVLVKDGDEVAAGQSLLRLRSDELDTEVVNLKAMISEKQKSLQSITSQIAISEQKGDGTESIRLQGEAAQLQIEIKGLSDRRAVTEKRIRALDIQSPIAGTIATFQLKQLLLDRPVERGDRLIQVMQTRGDWRLELDIPEHRAGHVLDAFHKQGENGLTVEYVLATAVENTHHASLSLVATRTTESESEGSILEAHGRLQETSFHSQLHVGSEVIAKVHCGKRSLGYCLFGDIVEFIRKYTWF